jgi:hypothetical protein
MAAGSIPAPFHFLISKNLSWTGVDGGYLRNSNALIGKQFLTEAAASLPGVSEIARPEAIFDAMEVQRLRLHHDQQLPERGP